MNPPKPKTQTATQAFCRACRKPVELPHDCPGTGILWVKIYMGRGM